MLPRVVTLPLLPIRKNSILYMFCLKMMNWFIDNVVFLYSHTDAQKTTANSAVILWNSSILQQPLIISFVMFYVLLMGLIGTQPKKKRLTLTTILNDNVCYGFYLDSFRLFVDMINSVWKVLYCVDNSNNVTNKS